MYKQKGFGIVGIVISLTLISLLGIVVWFVLSNNQDDEETVTNQSINSYEECVSAGYPIMESYPEQCSVPGGDTFTRVTEEDIIDEVAEGIVITSGDSDFGSMLFDENGQAIYIWELEESSEAECYDDCAVAWPPVLTEGTPVATGDVSNDLLGTTTRTDGTTQVTYNGHPLYYYADEAPGEVKCHNISTHGGLWWVIQPNGVRAD